MTVGWHIPQEDLALYAMQSLSGEESAPVRLHLDGCAACRAELAELSGDLALVAFSVEQHPLPQGARERFIQGVAATSDAQRQPVQAPVVSIVKQRPARRFADWAPWGAVAALVVIAVSLAIRINSLDQRLRDDSSLIAGLTASAAHSQEVLDVLTAPAAQRVLLTSVKTAALPTGRAVYLAARGGLIFEAANLPRLPEDKTYELWVIPASGSAPIPAGLFRPDATGSASLVLPPLPKGVPAKAFGVTIEKAEGAATPTAPIILAGAA
jgi:hypothetical protein